MTQHAECRAGRCLCDAVNFTVTGLLAEPVACHCIQCRRGSGHYTAATWAPREMIAIRGHVRWYAVKPGVQRGFCPVCGASLFWQTKSDEMVSIEMGAFDGSTGLRLASHIFVGEKGDYYELNDGLPQSEQE